MTTERKPSPNVWRDMKDAPKDDFILLRTPWTESGVTVAFWCDDEDFKDWCESEIQGSSRMYGNSPTGWAPLPEDDE